MERVTFLFKSGERLSFETDNGAAARQHVLKAMTERPTARQNLYTMGDPEAPSVLIDLNEVAAVSVA